MDSRINELISREKERRRRSSMEAAILSACLQSISVWSEATQVILDENKVDFDEFQVQALLGGMTNELFTCTLPERLCSTRELKRFSTVVVRLLAADLEEAFDRQQETKLMEYVARKTNISPQVLGCMTSSTFKSILERMTSPGDASPERANALRFEEFMHGEPVSRTNLMQEPTLLQAAERMAQLHRLRMLRADGDPPMLDKLLDVYARMAQIEEKDVDPRFPKEYAELLEELNWRKEINYVKQLGRERGGPIVLCHNDSQEGNWIILKSRSRSRESLESDSSSTREHNPLRLLDYEYSGYNYRGYDFANLFSEFVIDYETTDFPGFEIYEKDFPSDDKMVLFFNRYIEYLRKREPATTAVTDRGGIVDTRGQNSTFSLTTSSLISETKAMVPAVHLLWALWCLVMYRAKSVAVSNGSLQEPEFGFLQYGKERARLYKATK
eukprot:gb/GECG01011828.1/.p1 GENE.gb/GECG01011828.1/~~gb/GECG01011828.1/.p1  ORF type:complete len:442 (+),score=44.91 gb/GECG01011828.1/:1-1326(+)